MHELGIAMEIIDIVTEQARGARVRRIVLEIGTLTAVLPDAIRFCFDACSADTVVEGAKLETVEMPGRAQCRSCGGQVISERPWGYCPCGSLDLEWVSGMELTIRELELA